MFRTGKTVLARRVDRNNRQRLCILGLSSIFGPFFFEFSKVNVWDEQIFIICNINHIRIFQRQFDDGSCFHSAQDLTRRIFLIKNRYFIFIEKLLNVLSLSDYWTVGLPDSRTTGPSDYQGVGL